MKVALVTGGGTGIGRAAALELNKIDFVVYVVGRREEELNKTSSLAENKNFKIIPVKTCLLYTSPSPRDMRRSRMPSSA